MKFMIWFDMDGTLNKFYSYPDWLAYLQNNKVEPYLNAAVNLNMNVLARYLNRLQAAGYGIGIISWLSKTSTEEYDEAVTMAKLSWLKLHLNSVNWNEINIVKYGTAKESFMKYDNDILFDDEEKNRNNWHGNAYEPNEILETLHEILAA